MQQTSASVPDFGGGRLDTAAAISLLPFDDCDLCCSPLEPWGPVATAAAAIAAAATAAAVSAAPMLDAVPKLGWLLRSGWLLSCACFLTQSFQACTTFDAAAATVLLLLLLRRFTFLPASVSFSNVADTCAFCNNLRISKQRPCWATSSDSAPLAASTALFTSLPSSAAAIIADTRVTRVHGHRINDSISTCHALASEMNEGDWQAMSNCGSAARQKKARCSSPSNLWHNSTSVLRYLATLMHCRSLHVLHHSAIR